MALVSAMNIVPVFAGSH